MKKSKLHQLYDIGALLTVITLAATIIWKDGHDHSWKENFAAQMNIRLDFLQKQIVDVKDSQNKILEILIEKKLASKHEHQRTTIA